MQNRIFVENEKSYKMTFEWASKSLCLAHKSHLKSKKNQRIYRQSLHHYNQYMFIITTQKSQKGSCLIKFKKPFLQTHVYNGCWRLYDAASTSKRRHLLIGLPGS